MRCFRAFSFFVICHVTAWTFSNAVRDHGRLESRAECLHSASPSGPEFDFQSLFFDAPKFSFLEAQEFFISESSGCQQPWEQFTASYVPRDVEAKTAQLQQRFVVKHIKDILSSASKQDVSKIKNIGKVFFSKVEDKDRVPAVEVHMFPTDVHNISSPWRVLLIPRAREVYGKRLFLCRSQDASAAEAIMPCVAELHFPALPLRLMHMIKKWSPRLDASRSTSGSLMLCMDLLLLASAIFLVCRMVLSLREIVAAAWELYRSPKDEARFKELLQTSPPKSFVLLQHALLYEGGDNLEGLAEMSQEPLDACEEVKVVKVLRGERARFGFRAQMNHFLFHRGNTAVWGRLESPPCWIILADGADLRVLPKGELLKGPWCADASLLVPFASLLKRQLVLVASHCSGQWLLLEHCSRSFRVDQILAMSIGLFILHVATLSQMEATHASALEYEEVLESEQKLLKLQRRNTIAFLAMGGLVMVVSALVAGLSGRGFAAALPSFPLAAVIVVHLLDLKSSRGGLEKWRSPQLKATEFTSFSSSGFSSRSSGESVEISSEKRFRKYVLRALIWLLATGGLSLLIFIVLDGLQMRGELVDYSVSRGFITTPPHALTMQNTLLLHKNVDSFTFSCVPGPFTSKVQLRLEHPLLESNDTEMVPLFEEETAERHGGEFTVSLPAGPLYGRLIIQAESHLHEKPTEYTMHVLRVGDDISLSLGARINPVHFELDTSVQFMERRTWAHHASNPEWYVPDLDPHTDITFQVVHVPVVLAPLLPYESRTEVQDWKSMSLLHSRCECGKDQPGYGNSCGFEERIGNSDAPLCLFQHWAKSHLWAKHTFGSVSSNASRLREWLSDVNVSGKSASIWTIDEASNPSTWPLQIVPDGFNVKSIRSIFRTSMSTQLKSQAAQLGITTTQDQTDAEEMVVPFKVVSHAPPTHLSLNVSGFFLPEQVIGEQQSEHAVCGVRDLTGVNGMVLDKRFTVESAVVSKNLDCDGRHTLQELHFKAVRKPDKSCGSYCSLYNPWSGTDQYDVSVVLSVSRCFDQAIELGNVARFQDILGTMDEAAKLVFDACGTLRKAIERNQTRIAKEILNSGHASPDGQKGGESPLQAAAADGNLPAMELLLDMKADVNYKAQNDRTALFAAVQNCQVDAVKFLLSRGSEANALMALRAGSKCQVTPLLALFDDGRSSRCQADKLGLVIGELTKFNHSNLSLPAKAPCDLPQTALIMALDHRDLAAAEQLLDLGADPNEEGRHSGDLAATPFDLELMKHQHYQRDLSSFRKVVQLLALHGAEIDRQDDEGFTPLLDAASECKREEVEILLDAGADPDKVSDDGSAEELVDSKEESDCPKASADEIKRLLKKKREERRSTG